MAQLLEGNASALAEVKDQSAEMLSLLKQLAAAPPAASGAGAAVAMKRWEIDAKSVKFETEEDDDGFTAKVMLGSGSFGTVYVCVSTRSRGTPVQRLGALEGHASQAPMQPLPAPTRPSRDGGSFGAPHHH